MNRNDRAMAKASSNVFQTSTAKSTRQGKNAQLAQASSMGKINAARLAHGGNFYNAQGTKTTVEPTYIPQGAVSSNIFKVADKKADHAQKRADQAAFVAQEQEKAAMRKLNALKIANKLALAKENTDPKMGIHLRRK
jgi:hypothetical protein